jgi:eukaryotic-like serine/threonine-protein kinase
MAAASGSRRPSLETALSFLGRRAAAALHSRAAESFEMPSRYDTAVFLGEGGMGSVFRAFDPVLGRPVALKFLHQNNPALVERLMREARLQAGVDHPNVCRVYEVGEADGRPYIAMQYVEGQTLEARSSSLTLDQKVRLMAAVADGVHAANRTGLVHRDLKPGNIMVESRDGELHPYVLDFGLAREAAAEGLTDTGLALGSPPYMAPEQARGDVHALDRRTDVYGLGAVLYELVAGRPPFQGKSTVEILLKVLHEDPVPLRRLVPSVPTDVETIALKCLEKDPARRYDSARHLADDLRRFLNRDPVEARRAGRAYRLSRTARKHRAVLTVAAVGLALTATAMGTSVRARWRASDQAAIAQGFGQEIERIEGALRQAYLLPLHDVAPDRRRVRDRMKHIEAEMALRGPVSFGPGHYALGRGYLALGDAEKARGHLETASNAGYAGAEVRAALGRALGSLYSAAIEEAARMPGEEGRRRREDAETRLREPALACLKDVPDSAAELTPALIAYYEKRYEEARGHLRTAVAADPGLFEADLLQGQVETSWGQERMLAGDYEGAVAGLERAGEAYARAAEIARSAPEVRAAECERLGLVLEVKLDRGSAADALFETVVRACDAASRVDPEAPQPHAIRSRVLWRWAEYLGSHGHDARPRSEEAVAAARAAARLGSRDADTFSALGLALWTAAESGPGADQPRPLMREAAGAFERAAALRPNWVNAYGNLSALYNALADYELAHGEDPGASLDQAARHAKSAIEAAQERYWQVYSNLGLSQWVRAAWLSSRGQDPEPALAPARVAFGRAVQLNPKAAIAHRGLAGAETVGADYELARGGDPRERLARIRRSAQLAIEANPDYANAYVSLGLADAIEAEYLSSRGADPEAVFRAGRAHFRKALAINATSADGLNGLRRLELTAARADLERGRSPQRALEAAAAAVRRLLAAEPSHPDAARGEAEVHRWRAEWLLRRGIVPADDLRHALLDVERALEINRLSPEAAAVLVRLRTLEARAARDPGTRATALARAQAAMEDAVRMNALVARTYAADLPDGARPVAVRAAAH